MSDVLRALVLPKLEGVKKSGASWMARCPAHDDGTASLSVAAGDKQPVVLNCHAGCDPEDVIAALGLTWAALSTPRDSNDEPVAVTRYQYTDEYGEVLFVKVRLVPKGFYIEHPDGRGGWKKGMGGAPRVLYQLPKVINAVKNGATIWIAEGEKDAEALGDAGVTATSNCDGASKEGQRPKVRPEDAEPFKGAAEVVVVADDDAAGHAHAQAWKKILTGYAASVRIVVPAAGKDAHDHFAAGKTLAEFVPLDGEHDTGPHLPGIPGYPVDALTGPLRELVDACALSGLPATLAAGAGLAALATVCGQAELQVYETWLVRPLLWVPLIAPAGGGKTPAINIARRRLRDLDAAAHQQLRNEMDAWLELPKKDRGDRPEDTTRLINDITIEMVARWLDRGDGTGGVDADELSEFLRSLSKYRQGGGTDAGRWLAMWSTQPWRYQRVGSDIDLLLARPVLTVCGGLQPHLLHLLGPEGDGMRPRWLPHLSLTADLCPQPGHTAPGWDAVIETLYNARRRRIWTLAGAALKAWQRAQRRWQAARQSAESPSTTAALAKADEQCARIALVIAESVSPGAGGEIPAEAMTAAVAITDYCLDCWRALPEHRSLALSLRDERLDTGVDELAEWLERHGGRAITRQIKHAHVAGVRTTAEQTALLERYEAVYPGSIRSETPEERKGKPGRAGIVVCAPRRGDTPSPDSRSHVSDVIVAGHNYTDTHTSSAPGRTAGHGDPPPTAGIAAAGHDSPGHDSLATITSAESGELSSGLAAPPAPSSNGQHPPGHHASTDDDSFWAGLDTASDVGEWSA